MFYTQSDRMFTEKAQGRDGGQVPLHNTPGQPQNIGELSGSDSDERRDGTWGERDEGGPVDFRHAMEDYEEMRQELTHLSKVRTEKSTKSQRRLSFARRPTTRQSNTHTLDLESQTRDRDDQEEQSGEDGGDDFELGDFLKDGHFEKRQEGRSAKKVGLVYKNLTVQGIGASAVYAKTLPSAVLGVSSSLPTFTKPIF